MLKKIRPLSLAPENRALDTRFRRTLEFITKSLPPCATLLDLGPPNRLGNILTKQGYTVHNTEGDLDDHPDQIGKFSADAVTAFEIFEHLLAPLQILRQITAPRLYATVPLKLWFAKAYTNPQDPWDCHYHEFESWQFDRLLEKGGWQIIRSEKWKSPALKLGIRPLLRCFFNRYYAVEAIRLNKLEVSMDKA